MTEQSEITEDVRVGDTMRQAREARGLDLADVYEETRIAASYLKAIEDMYLPGIPKGYLNIFLRTYAKFLNLPVEDTLAQFAEQCGAVSQSAPKEQTVPQVTGMSPKMRGALLATAAAALLTIGGAGAMFMTSGFGGQDGDTPQIAQSSAPVNGARESLFASADRSELSAQLPLHLVAVQAGWLEVRAGDGTIFRSRKMAAGETYYPRIGAGWSVTARDGGAFTWKVGDIEIGPMGEVGSPVYALSVDTIALDAQAIATPALAAFGESIPTR